MKQNDGTSLSNIRINIIIAQDQRIANFIY